MMMSAEMSSFSLFLRSLLTVSVLKSPLFSTSGFGFTDQIESGPTSLLMRHLCLDLLHCTNEPNVSIPTLANLLIERTQNPNWVVVFKGLITTAMGAMGADRLNTSQRKDAQSQKNKRVAELKEAHWIQHNRTE